MIFTRLRETGLIQISVFAVINKVTRGKWEVGGMGKCVTNAASTTDWPHFNSSIINL